MKVDTVKISSFHPFFFSSRRRHTRYIGDWSSDVCSSDLAADTTYSGKGQLWVKNDVPNTLWFTDDAGTDVQLGTGGSVSPLTADLDGNGYNLDDMGVLFQREQASADADVTNQGQWWVKTATPNVPMFTNDAGTDYNLLGDEGTFTPVLLDTTYNPSESQTYYTQNGIYTRIGDMCFFTLDVHVNSLGTLSTSVNAYVGGLPFTCDGNATRWSVVVGYASSLVQSAETSMAGRVVAGTNRIELEQWDSTGGMTNTTIAEVSAGGDLTISGFYRIA